MIDFIKRINSSLHIAVAEDWMWEKPAQPEEEVYISRAVEKRKREFRAGRHCAHQVLTELGHSGATLKVGEHRQPLWPENIIGSISHTDRYCACVAMPKGDIISVGIDVEKSEPVDKSSLPLICTRREMSAIEEMQSSIDLPLCKLIFSAKECVHKVYYPLNQHTLDFLDAEIQIDLEKSSFEAIIHNSEKSPKLPIKVLKGFFHYDSHYVYTIIMKELE